MYGAQRRDRRVCLFCSQTLPPSNYVYIELSARVEAPPALGCLHGLSSSSFSKILCRVGVSRNFSASAYGRCNAGGNIIIYEKSFQLYD